MSASDAVDGSPPTVSQCVNSRWASSALLAEAERHPDHHLDADALFGASGVDPHDNTACTRANTDTTAELHVLVQLREVPIGSDAADLDEGCELEPVDAQTTLQPGPTVERVPFGCQAQFG